MEQEQTKRSAIWIGDVRPTKKMVDEIKMYNIDKIESCLYLQNYKCEHDMVKVLVDTIKKTKNEIDIFGCFSIKTLSEMIKSNPIGEKTKYSSIYCAVLDKNEHTIFCLVGLMVV